MIRMVPTLNESNFRDQELINCNTCHRGHVRPSAPLAFAPIVEPRPTPKAAVTASIAGQPTVGEIFDRYIRATGGTIALETLVMQGTMSSSEGWTAPLEWDQKAPDKSLMTFELKGRWRSGFNSRDGWGQDNQGVHTLAGRDLALFRLRSAFLRPDTLMALYSDLVFAGTDTVAGSSAYVVEGKLIGVGPQRLFFDRRTGLLVRVTSSSPTPFGPLPEEFDLENYRSFAGVTLPSTVSDLKPDFSSIDHFVTGRKNVRLEDAKFDRKRRPRSPSATAAGRAGRTRVIRR